MKYILFVLVFLFSATFFTSCCSPRDFARNNQFVRNLFYPDELKSGFETGKGLGENTPGKKFDHSRYTYLLKNYVNNKGFVDYDGLLSEEKKLDEYLHLLSEAEYEKLSRYEKLAFLLNAYNAFTLKLIVQHPGISSIKDIPAEKRWEDSVWNLAGEKVSLSELEHKKIRGEFGEPKIHFALVCAAESCPELRQEPYTGEKLLPQLDNQAKQFFSTDKNFRWDKKNKTVYLSEIMDWYRYDFAEDELGVLSYTLNFINEKEAGEIGSSLEKVDVKYIPYNWELNGNWN